MSDFMTASSDLAEYRARLSAIARRMESITAAWSRLEPADAARTLGTLHNWARNLKVPLGCRPAQRALIYAMRSYETAQERLDRARASGSRSEFEAAWGYVRDGDVLLALAIEMANQA
jgi:hypothetical protein